MNTNKLLKKTRSKFLIMLAAFMISACNYADKRSSLEKDSIGGDTRAKNIIGGTATFESRLDEEATDHLKQLTLALLFEYHLLEPLDLSQGSYKRYSVKELMPLNHNALNRIEKYGIEKRVFLPSIILPKHQKQIDALNSLKKLDRVQACIVALKANMQELSLRLNSAKSNREQDFKTLMQGEAMLQKQKMTLINSW